MEENKMPACAKDVKVGDESTYENKDASNQNSSTSSSDGIAK